MRYLQHGLRGKPQHLNNEAHLLVFLVASKEGITQVKFGNDAGETPYIDFVIVRQSQNYLRGTIVSTLNVSVNGLFLEAAGTEINDLHS